MIPPKLPTLPFNQYWQIDEAQQLITQFLGDFHQDLYKKVLVVKLMENRIIPASRRGFFGRLVPQTVEPVLLSSVVLSYKHSPSSLDDDGFPIPTDESVARAAQEALDLWKTAMRKQNEHNSAYRKYIGTYPPKRFGQ